MELKFDRKKLKRLREGQGMTIRILAQAADIHENQVGSYERGPTSPGINIAGRLAQALGCEMKDFMSDTTTGNSDIT